MNRILDLCIGALGTLRWLFTKDPEHDLMEPPQGAPEVGCVYWDDCA